MISLVIKAIPLRKGWFCSGTDGVRVMGAWGVSGEVTGDTGKEEWDCFERQR